MKLLSLSTAEQGCSLAIVDGSQLICEEFWNTKITHSRRLVTMIEHMFEKRAGMELADIDGFLAARGPGSFTGLRIGISVIKGLAYAMEKPTLGVSSLDGIAYRFAHSSIPVCIMMDARRNEVYSAVFKFDNGILVSKSEERVVNPLDAIGMAKGPALFAGSGSKVYRQIIEQMADRPFFSHEFLDSVSATALVRSWQNNLHGSSQNEEDLLTQNQLNQNKDTLFPSYIRKSDAQLQFAQKQGY